MPIVGPIGDSERVALQQRLVVLKGEHRELDTTIHRLAEMRNIDQVQLTLLKRRKLLLKDQIASIERALDPDILA